MQAEWFKEVRWKAAMAIAGARKGGMRHRIKLAHIAIKALDRKAERFLEGQTRG
jgi:hypothetical protein